MSLLPELELGYARAETIGAHNGQRAACVRRAIVLKEAGFREKVVPQSITIAAFVFGAVLLLIALLGGGFKIFGAEVSGKAGAFGRPVAGITGMVLLMVGLFGSGSLSSDRTSNLPPSTQSSTSLQSAAPAASTGTPSDRSATEQRGAETRPGASSSSPQPRTTPTADTSEAPPITTPGEPAHEHIPNVSGTWHDAAGVTYVVKQQGSRFTVSAYGVGGTSEGTGTISGSTYQSVYSAVYANGVRSTGRCSGMISADGSAIEGTCFDSVLGQTYNVLSR